MALKLKACSLGTSALQVKSTGQVMLDEARSYRQVLYKEFIQTLISLTAIS